MPARPPNRRRRSGRAPAIPHLTQAAQAAGLSDGQLETVRLWLQAQLIGDQYARLEQAGHAENRVPLRRVFVDLPYSVEGLYLGEQGRSTFLARFVEQAPVTLKPREEGSPLEDERDSIEMPGPYGLFAPRARVRSTDAIAGFLLIGGPGQGKSTLGQLACQLQRVSLLKPWEASLSEEARQVLPPFYEKPRGKAPRVPGPPTSPLLPLRFALPEVATWLYRQQNALQSLPEGHLLLAWLTSLRSAQESGLTLETLLALLPHMPLLLVLDGFDELGGSADRHRVANAIQELLRLLTQQKCQVKLLAASRPQGYLGELKGLGIRLLEVTLPPLTKDEALQYGEHLIRAKVSGLDLQKKLEDRLEEAAQDASSAQLFQSPLQLAILTGLLQQGRAPRERWRLFKGYFEFTYQREIERETYASRLLADYRPHIEALHRRAGLLLQAESEREGGSSARLTAERLRALAQQILVEEGLEGEALDTLVDQICEAAQKRLVFLVEPEPLAFGFELRSLQELMAAWQLSEGKPEEVLLRMRHIAPAPYFRNVLLFMASRFFSEGLSLRDAFAQTLCPELNASPEDPLLRVSRAGGLLALQLLENESLQTQPKRRDALLELALGVLEGVEALAGTRLGGVALQYEVVPTVLQRVEELLLSARSAEEPAPKAVWACLGVMLEVGVAEGESLFFRLFPSGEQLLEVELLQLILILPIDWLARHAPDRVDWFFMLHQIEMASLVLPAGTPLHPWIAYVVNTFRQRGSTDLLRLEDQPLLYREEAVQSVPPPVKPLVALATYERSPSAITLAYFLMELTNNARDKDWRSLANYCSWPARCCLLWADDLDQLDQLAADIRAGSFGDIAEWREAQAHWEATPDAKKDWLAQHEHFQVDAPWSKSALQRIEPPLFRLHPVVPPVSGVQILSSMEFIQQKLSSSPSPEVRRRLTERYVSLIRNFRGDSNLVHKGLTAALILANEEFELILPRPPNLSDEQWIQLVSKSRAPTRWSLPYAQYLSDLKEGISETLIKYSAHHLSDLLTALKNDATLISLQDALRDLVQQDFPDAPEAAAAAVLLRWALLRLDNCGNEAEAALLQEYSHSLLWLAHQQADTLEHQLELLRIVQPESRLPYHEQHLAALLERPATQWRLLFDGLDLAPYLRTRHAGLYEQERWAALALPAPAPEALPLPASEALPSDDFPVVALSRLHLENVRGLHSLSLELALPEPDRGQWILFLGPNAVGKTTLLRAIVLALSNLQDPSIWPDGAFSPAWRRQGTENEPSYLELKLHGRLEPLRVTFREGAAEQAPPTQKPVLRQSRLVPLFAYGCRRGSALGGAARAVNLRDDGGPEVATLFNERSSLIHAVTWLQNWRGEAADDLEKKAIFESILQALARLLDVPKVELSEESLWIWDRHGQKLPLEALSDGYLTTAGWFIDLLARWIDLQRRNKRSLPPGFLELATGLVLLDELDLHLHPLWQRELIGRIQGILPRMSFVVTSHSPLTLVGARPQDIWILSRSGEQVCAEQGSARPLLLTTAQLYSHYFGIEGIYPTPLGKKVDRYAFLSRYALRDDDEETELQQLKGELEQARLLPPWEIEPRLLEEETLPEEAEQQTLESGRDESAQGTEP